MALRVSPCIHIPTPVASKERASNLSLLTLRARSDGTSNSTSSSVKEDEQINTTKMRGGGAVHSSPKHHLPTVEEASSRFGLEMAIAGLERLLREGDCYPPGAAGSPGRRLRVGYQGVRGSYCMEAAARAFPSSACEAFPCGHNMEDAFSALEDRFADRAVVPAENSLDGPIDRNLDLLLRHPRVRIVGELVLPVRHSLLCPPGAPRSGLRRVVSHPQALDQCRAGLDALGLEVEEVPNAADAARLVAEDRLADTAVIASGIAAREFGLQVLERDFQDPGGNFTRFLEKGVSVGPGNFTLGLGPALASSGARKTTVAFTLEKGVSALYRALWGFESRGVRVTRIDHRPNRSRPLRLVQGAAHLDYVFVLDLQGSESDPPVAAALARLTEIAGVVRVLGTYTSTYGS